MMVMVLFTLRRTGDAGALTRATASVVYSNIGMELAYFKSDHNKRETRYSQQILGTQRKLSRDLCICMEIPQGCWAQNMECTKRNMLRSSRYLPNDINFHFIST